MSEKKTGIQSTETAFDIIEQVKRQNGAGITELSSDLDLAKSTVHKHLATLCKRGYMKKNGNVYNLAMRFLDLGIHARNHEHIYQLSKDKIDGITEETGEKVWLITEEYGRSIHLYGTIGKHTIRTYARIGQLTYLHQLAAGKAILAQFSDDRIHKIVDDHGLPAQTRYTITSRAQLFNEIEKIRKQGYATNIEETVRGLHSIGAAIQDAHGNPLAAISISGPANRINGKRFEEDLPSTLLSATNELEINIDSP